ncbi:MAG: Uncharacterised protein [Bacteroidota bacterium]|nr:MAG: Uncharacterised protein [Bacteroidota bacterium]
MKEAKTVLTPFVLAFAGLKEGIHHFSLDITSKFFDAFDYTEFNAAALNAQVELNKKASMLELQFSITGTVNVSCDLSNEPFDLPINPHHNLVVKFGEVFNDENEELLVLPHGSHQVDVAQTLFETVVLAIPQKRVHPGIENGSLHSDLLDRLDALHPNESTKAPETNDPRWDALKKLKKD